MINPLRSLSDRHQEAASTSGDPTFATRHMVKAGDLAGYALLADSWHRQQLTRALTAQAWAVACAAFDDYGGSFEPLQPNEHLISDREREYGAMLVISDLAALPCPAEMASQILGD